jgi:PAS domain S-box-containing protein
MSEMKRNRSVLAVYLLACLAAIATYFSVDANGILGSISYDFLALSATVVIVFAVLRRGARPRAAWLLIAGATLCWGLGDITWSIYDLLHLPVPFPSVADISYLAAYPLLGAGTWLIARERGRSSGAFADAAFVTVGLGLAIWTFIGEPNSGSLSWATIVGLAYPLADVILIGFLTRLIYAPNASWSDRLLAVSLALTLVADVVYGAQSLAGTYVSGSLLDVGWMLAYPLVGVAALVSRRVHGSNGHVGRSETVTPARLLVMGGVLSVVLFLFVRAIALPAVGGGTVVIYAVTGATLMVMFLAKMGSMMRRSVSASAQLVASESRYRDIVENAIEGIYRTSMDGRVLEANLAMANIVGFPTTEALLTANRVSSYYAEPDARERLLAQLHRDGSVTGFETSLTRVDGRNIWVRISARLVLDPNGEPVAIDGILADVTEYVRADRERENALVREREVSARLRAVDEMKNGFLTAVSHELRTPLTSIVGFADLLNDQASEFTPAETRDFVDRISSNAHRLQRLLGDLLDVDRLARGALEPHLETADLAGLITAVTAANAERLGDRVRLVLQPVTIAVDGPMVERIVENLLTNALRYTPPESPIMVGLSRTADGGARIVVEDRGLGIPKAIKASIFEPFHQGPGVVEHSPGIGIGLSIVDRFARLHGGRVWVEDASPTGARFVVTLPGGPAPAGKPSERTLAYSVAE